MRNLVSNFVVFADLKVSKSIILGITPRRIPALVHQPPAVHHPGQEDENVHHQLSLL